MAEAHSLIGAKFDEAEKRLDSIDLRPVGSGMVELGAYVDPTGFGARLNAEDRLTENISAFGTAWAGVATDSFGKIPDVGAMIGLRVHW